MIILGFGLDPSSDRYYYIIILVRKKEGKVRYAVILTVLFVISVMHYRYVALIDIRV